MGFGTIPAISRKASQTESSCEAYARKQIPKKVDCLETLKGYPFVVN